MSARAFTRGAVAVGGATLAAGAVSPWMNVFAGLEHYTGMIGFNGRALFTVGVLLATLPMSRAFDEMRWLSVAATVVAVASAAFCAWLIVGLFEIVHHGGMSSMLVPTIGPGLFIALAGTLIAAAGGLARLRLGGHER